MANGYGTFSNRSQYRLRMTITQGTQDAANNRTSVNWSTVIEETTEWGSYSFSGATYSAVVNGSTVGSNGNFGYDFRNYNTLTLGSGSIWVTHGSDGTKTVSASASVGGGTTIGSASASVSLTLTRIPKPPTAPGTPTFSGIGPKGATAAWSAPSNNNGSSITGYQIQLTRDDANFSPPTEHDDVQGTARTKAWDDLAPAVDYACRVRAKNSSYDQWGSYSGTGRFKTKSGAYVGLSAIFQGAEILVGDPGSTSFVPAEIYVGDPGSSSFVPAG